MGMSRVSRRGREELSGKGKNGDTICYRLHRNNFILLVELRRGREEHFTSIFYFAFFVPGMLSTPA
jgi:hypothetical protein